MHKRVLYIINVAGNNHILSIIFEKKFENYLLEYLAILFELVQKNAQYLYERNYL